MAGSTMPNLDALRRAVDGTVLGPDDERYNTARQPWNLAVQQRPPAVVEVGGADDIVSAVHFARDHGMGVTAQPTGHSATHAHEDALLLRTGHLRDVDVDAARHVARIAPGARWGDVQAAAEQHGLAGLAGTAPHLSATGYLLGGGCSWLGRPYGVAANTVRAVELVTADGRHRRIDADDEPDLFWAVRGGGGNFGIVTAMEIDLVPVQQVYAGMLMWPIERAADVLPRWRAWVEAVPDATTSLAMLLRVPPLPSVPEPLRGQAFVTVGACHVGDATEGADVLEPLRRHEPAMDTFAPMGVTGLGAVHQDPEDPLPSAGAGSLLDDVTDTTIEQLIDVAGPGADVPLLFVELRHLGAAFARRPGRPGALDHVSEPFLIHSVGPIMGPDHAPAVHEALQRVDEAVADTATGHNFLTFVESLERLPGTFPDDVLQRLLDVKQRYDPDDVIRSSTPLAAARPG